MADELLSVDELVARWKGTIARSTLAGWRTRRRGPAFIKIGAKVLYPVKAVEEFEAKHVRLPSK